MTDLLPCPFCGGEAVLTGEQAPEFWVRCPTIGCKASTEGFGAKERSVAAWNRRAPDEATRIATAEACARIAERTDFIALAAEHGIPPDDDRPVAHWYKRLIATAIRLQQGSEKP